MSNFKIGDWVREPDGDIWKLDNEVEKGSYVDTDCELWQPKIGEWCWYVASGGFVKCLEYITENKFDGCYLGGSDATCYIQDCEPFVGKLPSFLKDNK
jgi:hypothetical protein